MAAESICLVSIGSESNGATLKKIRTSNGDYDIKQWFSSIASLFKMGTSPKGKNLLPEGANSFLSHGMEHYFYHIR